MIQLANALALTAALFTSGANTPASVPTHAVHQTVNAKNDRYHAARSLVATVDRITAVIRLANKQAHGDSSLEKGDITALGDEMKVLHKLKQWHVLEFLATMAKELDSDLTAIGVRAADLQLKIRGAESTLDMLNKIAP